MASPSHSQPQDEPDPEMKNQRDGDPLPGSPQTLEARDLPNPETIELDRTMEAENLQEKDNPEDVSVINHGGDPRHHNLDPEDQIGQQLGMSPSLDSLSLFPSNELNNPPFPSPAPRRNNKRKKLTSKKKQTIERKLQTLTQNLKPIPFVPCKVLDFDKHEKLLKRLGLWDFVHIEFDRKIRVDLITQLIAYHEQQRCSYVNDFRINVSRADLARALKLKLPVKSSKSNSSAEPVDLDAEEMSEESKAFIEDLVSNWVLLHEDTWMTPDEVMNWTKLIKDGHPEKVDWATLIWFMVEKELAQGEKLGECYYASHLQCLIKSQRPDLFLYEPVIEAETEVVLVEEVKEEVYEVKEEAEKEAVIESCGMKIGASDNFQEQKSHEPVVVEEPNIELTLGQEIVEKEEEEDEKDAEVADPMEVEESKVVEEVAEKEVEEQQVHWLVDGKNLMGGHFLQRCHKEEDNTEGDNKDMDVEEERKPEEAEHVDEEEEDEDEEEEEEDEEEEEADDVGVFSLDPRGHNLDSEVLTGNNLLQADASDMPFNLPEPFCDPAHIEFLNSRPEPVHANRAGPSIFGNSGKRVIEHDDGNASQEALDGSNKRMRTDGSWGHNASEFDMCMEQVQHLMGKARMIYEAKEQACQESTVNQEVLLNELERRAQMIEHLNRELERKNAEIFRYESELYVMSNVLEGYRSAMKETRKAFSEYRNQCQYPEEPIYKDAGPGGLVLTAVEVEKLRLKQEEDERLKLLLIQEQAKEFEGEMTGQFEAYFSQIEELDKKLMGWKNEVASLKEASTKKSLVSETELAHPSEVKKEDTNPMDSENEEQLLEEVSAKEFVTPETICGEVFPPGCDQNLNPEMMDAENEVNLVVEKEVDPLVEDGVKLVVELPKCDEHVPAELLFPPECE